VEADSEEECIVTSSAPIRDFCSLKSFLQPQKSAVVAAVILSARHADERMLLSSSLPRVLGLSPPIFFAETHARTHTYTNHARDPRNHITTTISFNFPVSL